MDIEIKIYLYDLLKLEKYLVKLKIKTFSQII
jgi:hypothetical protein